MYPSLADITPSLPLNLLRQPRMLPGATEGWLDAPTVNPLLHHLLDALSLGLLLVDAQAQVLHANQAARAICSLGAPLVITGQRLCMLASHRQQLDAALRGASRRQWAMLMLRHGGLGLSVGVVPMTGDDSCPDLTALLVVTPPGPPSSLALQFFCQAHRLTAAEGAVLSALCKGLPPSQIAAASGVALCTVRTHIVALREKTQATSVNHLLQMVGALPPMASAGLDPARHGRWQQA